ncbi:HAMP domain-containing sensor histidine kinase [Hippea alviniae]|uniref:HAMP domain-containing sensor histidine kinase n=1 Tax=Hippea alviniae TaxID=1279027 RepID=UPI0003B64F46|nr:HAMP domain-containing sensor histidine kinase [Hippea alviniae]
MRGLERLSLKARLVVFYSFLLALIAGILGISFFMDTKALLIERVAADMRARAKPVIQHWLYSKKGGVELRSIAFPLARDLTSRNAVALILDKNGKPIANGKVLPEEPVPPEPVSFYYKKALSGDNDVTYIVKHRGHEVLVDLIPLRKSPSGKDIVGVVQLSSSLKDINNILMTHALYLGVGVVITLIMGVVLGAVMISSALSGLNRVIDTCKEISEGNLDRRVHLPKRGDEIGRLASVFDEMVERMNTVFTAQKRFVANAAHELKTPLTALKGSAEVLLRSSLKRPEEVKSLSRGILKETERLANVCDRLLDIAKLDGAIHLKKTRVDVGSLVRECVTGFPNSGRKIVLREGPFVEVFADRDMLMQALFNLIHNAVKYTDEGGVIEVGWQLVENGVVIGVKDNGVGVSPDVLSHIFEPFYRDGKSSGAGLGLTLVRSVVEAHGGRVEVESEPGRGSFFRLFVPVE